MVCVYIMSLCYRIEIQKARIVENVLLALSLMCRKATSNTIHVFALYGIFQCNDIEGVQNLL